MQVRNAYVIEYMRLLHDRLLVLSKFGKKVCNLDREK